VDFKGFVEKAKVAAAAATEKAKEVAATASEQAAGAMNAALSPEQQSLAWDQAKGFAAATADKLSEFKDLGSEKLQALIASFEQALPAIQTAGYELTEFEVELGVTPKLIPHFKHTPKDPEVVARARELVRDNALGALILNGLLKAGEVHRQIDVAGFCFSHIEIELGLIPSVRLQYKNDGSGAPRPDGQLLLPSVPATPAAELPPTTDAAGILPPQR
jgi:hypothetical protein